MGSISQEQLHSIIFSKETGWQELIYELVRTEQLDPWDIDIVLLTKKYLEMIERLESLEESAFFISSKVLLAAAILLRIKSEFLLNSIPSIKELLGEKKTEGSTSQAFAFDFDYEKEELEILPRTPLERKRKITLQELMEALEKAMKTEQRRIKKKVVKTYDFEFILPKKRISIKKKISDIYKKIKEFFLRNKRKLTFTELVGNGNSREEKIACFIPLLHLDAQKKIYLRQEKPFSEIEIWLRET